MNAKPALIAALALAGSAQALACYTVYDAGNRVVYRGERAPVDMSLPLHETLGGRFPGATMVFNQTDTCTPVPMAQVARSNTTHVPANTIRLERTGEQRPVKNGPLLTDRRTATSLNLPYTPLAGEIVMVPPHAAARVDFSAMTAVPAPQVAQAPSTAVLGAGPAPTASDTVITEMHNPPVTAVQRGRSLAITR